MGRFVPISERSCTLISQLSHLIDDPVLQEWSKCPSGEIHRRDLVLWLKKTEDKEKKTPFLQASLRAALLQDLHRSFLISSSPDEKEREPEHKVGQIPYLLLVAAGTILAVCEGFDGIASILGSFTAIPTGIILGAGLVFSLLSVSVFFAFDLVEMSKQLGVSVSQSNELIDILLEQVEHIEAIRDAIDDTFMEESLDASERKELQQVLSMLIVRYNALDQARQSYLKALRHSALEGVKLATTAMTALFFFGGGFFAGQSIAMTVAGLFVASVSMTFWPVVVASTLVGCAALSLYWFVQRPVLKHLVGHWLGLDKDKIDALAGDESITRQKRALHTLDRKMQRFEKSQGNDEGSRRVVRSEGPLSSSAFFRRPRSHSLDEISLHSLALNI